MFLEITSVVFDFVFTTEYGNMTLEHVRVGMIAAITDHDVVLDVRALCTHW
jgi:hypothetical protein